MESSGSSASGARSNLGLRQQLSTVFIPPTFPTALNGDGLIKPSEYLRTMKSSSNSVSMSVIGSKGGSLATSREDLTMDEASSSSSSSSTHDDDQVSSTSSNDSGIVAGSVSVNGRVRGPTSEVPPPPPLPDDGPDVKVHDVTNHIPTLGQTNGSSNSNSNGNGSQPLGAIRLQDLQSVQLRRTEQKTNGTEIIQPKGLTSAVSTESLLESKSHLIEELKMSKDIQGIKKLKEEKAKRSVEEEKVRKNELNKIFNPEKFVDEVPEIDASGAPIPSWKRQMMAKKAAEKAKKDAEEKRLREAEEQRQISIPAWKRNLIQKKDSVVSEVVTQVQPTAKATNGALENKVNVPTQVTKSESKPSVLNGSSTVSSVANGRDSKQIKTEMVNAINSAKSNNVNGNENGHSGVEASDHRQSNPWMFQLRKTNSKLLLDG